MGNILVVDDERSICELLDIALRRDGHKVETVTGGEVAKRKIDSALFDVIVTDIKMPRVDGVEVLRHAHQISPDSAVILMTAVDDYEAAVEAVKAGGATDYIRKSPGLVDEVKLAIARSLTQSFAQPSELCPAPRRGHAQLARQPHRRQSGSGKTEADHPHRSHHQQHDSGLRRKRNRQGTGRPRRAYLLAASRRSLCLGQLRRLSGNAAGKRTLRLRQGRLHRSQPEPPRPVRSRRPGHDFSRRDRRDDHAHAGQAAARAAGAHGASGRRHRRNSGGCPRHRRHQPRSRPPGHRRHLPRGPLLSPERHSHSRARTARAPGRCSAAGQSLPEKICPRSREEHSRHRRPRRSKL